MTKKKKHKTVTILLIQGWLIPYTRGPTLVWGSLSLLSKPGPGPEKQIKGACAGSGLPASVAARLLWAAAGIPLGLVMVSFPQCSLWRQKMQLVFIQGIREGPSCARLKMTKCQPQSSGRLWSLSVTSFFVAALYLYTYIYIHTLTHTYDTNRRINWKEHWCTVYFTHWCQCFISHEPRENNS